MSDEKDRTDAAAAPWHVKDVPSKPIESLVPPPDAPSLSKCPRCSGNGRIDMLEHCPVCKGTGEVSSSTYGDPSAVPSPDDALREAIQAAIRECVQLGFHDEGREEYTVPIFEKLIRPVIERPGRYRCFFCEEVFTDRQLAYEHFGEENCVTDMPACVDPLRHDEKQTPHQAWLKLEAAQNEITAWKEKLAEAEKRHADELVAVREECCKRRCEWCARGWNYDTDSKNRMHVNEDRSVFHICDAWDLRSLSPSGALEAIQNEIIENCARRVIQLSRELDVSETEFQWFDKAAKAIRSLKSDLEAKLAPKEPNQGQ